MRGRHQFARVEVVLEMLASLFGYIPRSLRNSLLDAMRESPGLWGMGLRFAALKATASKVGKNVSVRQGVYLLNVAGLEISDNVSIHPMCYIDATGGVFIGSNVSIAHGVTIMSSTHNFDDVSVSINDQGISLRPTVIDDNVWIGAQSVIVAGVRIGSGSVVAANAVVTRDVEPGTVVAGSPARVIRRRGE